MDGGWRETRVLVREKREREREQKTREGGTFYVGHRCGGKATVSDNNN